MIRWSKWLGVLGLFLPLSVIAQDEDIYSYEKSLQYAEYLIKTNQYQPALTELDRMIISYPQKDTLKIMYANTCYTAGRYRQGAQKIREWYLLADMPMPFSLTLKYSYLLLEQDSFSALSEFIDTASGLLPAYHINYRFNNALLTENWQKADSLATTTLMRQSDKYTKHIQLLNEGRNLKYKKPFLAGLYSGIVPGLGKVYAKDAKDGIYGFLTVAIPAFSAYRGFAKRGNESVYGWVNLGLASFFYVGNIYGAVRSAKQFNKNTKDAYRKKVKNNIYNYRLY